MPFHFIYKDFFRFLEALGHETPWDAYRKYYYDPHQAFLDSYWLTFRWMDLEQVRARVERIKASDYAHLRCLLGSVDIEHMLESILSHCSRMMEVPEEPEIYILVGFFSADGFVLEHRGKPLMGFGLERIKNWRLLPVLFAHEYAHYVRHLFLSDEPYFMTGPESAQRSLITEGLAIAFSEAAYPDYPLREHLLLPEERVKWCLQNTHQVVDLALRVWRGEERAAVLWSGDADQGIGPRLGNFIGYLLVKKILMVDQEYSLYDLLKSGDAGRLVKEIPSLLSSGKSA